jgi:hypothetical protein
MVSHLRSTAIESAEIDIPQALGLQHLCNSFRSLDSALHGNERIAAIRYHLT